MVSRDIGCFCHVIFQVVKNGGCDLEVVTISVKPFPEFVGLVRNMELPFSDTNRTEVLSDIKVEGFCRAGAIFDCLLYTSPSPRDATLSRMPSSA